MSQEYDEMKFLEISEGRCSQDALFIRKLEELPDYVRERANRNIVECSIVENKEILCIFMDDTIRKIDISKLSGVEDLDKIISNEKVFQSVKVGTGGYSIIFNDSMEISARRLYNAGIIIPLTIKDFVVFIQKNVVDASESCEILECSRQNLSYLVKEEYVSPIKENAKGNLYLKGDILKNRW